jgi:cyclopropane fatty-acyl-phospholipid synthase-like methyltransferase
MNRCKILFNEIFYKIFPDKTYLDNPRKIFHSEAYLRHNARRLEHLASLRIPVSGLRVLELGAGVGDHSHYYIDRGCRVTITEARPENVRCLQERYPHQDVRLLDVETSIKVEGAPFDLVHCYGLLYHLAKPVEALEFFSNYTKRLLFLETCVSYGTEEQIHLVSEPKHDPSQAYSGTGCRPTRSFIYTQLKKWFPFVYLPKTQPNHEQFPLDWTAAKSNSSDLQRAIFIASRESLANEGLVEELIMHQVRHE